MNILFVVLLVQQLKLYVANDVSCFCFSGLFFGPWFCKIYCLDC